MNILLTNDDGYYSPGLQTILDHLGTKHNFFVCAPLTQKSASSHGIVLHKELEMHIFSNSKVAIEGTPVNCVKFGLSSIFKDKNIDLVLSGINMGANMGEDIYYSGTVGAAREATLSNITGIACSLNAARADYDEFTKEDFEKAIPYLDQILDSLTEDLLKTHPLININFPDPAKDIKGIRFSTLGKRIFYDKLYYDNTLKKTTIQIDRKLPGHANIANSDFTNSEKGYITITPLAREHADMDALKKYNCFKNNCSKNFFA